MNTLQRILTSGGISYKWWSLKHRIRKAIVLLWQRLVGINPYGIWPDGACPVQAEGYTKDGKWYYFRARGQWARLVICESEDDYTGLKSNDERPYLFEREVLYGTHDYQAGWMTHADAIRLCTVWFNEYYVVQQQLKISKKSMKWLNKKVKSSNSKV